MGKNDGNTVNNIRKMQTLRISKQTNNAIKEFATFAGF